jgi:hypothetical protein
VLGNKIYFFIYFNKQGIVYQTLRDWSGSFPVEQRS